MLQVRGATTAGQLAAAAEALETALRRIALSSSWDAAQKPLGHGALNPGLGRRWAPTAAQTERKPLSKQLSNVGTASEPPRKSLGRPRKSSVGGTAAVAPATGDHLWAADVPHLACLSACTRSIDSSNYAARQNLFVQHSTDG